MIIIYDKFEPNIIFTKLLNMPYFLGGILYLFSFQMPIHFLVILYEYA